MKTSLALLALVSVSALAAPPGGMRPGLWETTVQSSMGGGKPIATRSCITAQQLADPKGAVPKMDNPQMKCEQVDYKVNGNTINWKMRCTGEVPMDGVGQMTSGPDNYSGKMDMTMKMQGQSMIVSNTMTGKRVGDCPAK